MPLRCLIPAVKKWGRTQVEVEQAIIDDGERAANQLRSGLRVFSAIATLGPLLGLLGTVFGMISSFNNIAYLQAIGKPQLLAAGINNIAYHGTPYSPADAPWPGWLFYASVHFAPTRR